MLQISTGATLIFDTIRSAFMHILIKDNRWAFGSEFSLQYNCYGNNILEEGIFPLEYVNFERNLVNARGKDCTAT